jgi:hypothetical protein
VLIDRKYLIFVVTALICNEGLICDVNETNFSVKCNNYISVSQIGCRHLCPATPPTSTSGGTSSSMHVLPKGPVVRVLLVHC